MTWHSFFASNFVVLSIKESTTPVGIGFRKVRESWALVQRLQWLNYEINAGVIRKRMIVPEEVSWSRAINRKRMNRGLLFGLKIVRPLWEEHWVIAVARVDLTAWAGLTRRESLNNRPFHLACPGVILFLQNRHLNQSDAFCLGLSFLRAISKKNRQRNG